MHVIVSANTAHSMERALIGGILQDPAFMDEIETAWDDFEVHGHRQLWRLIVVMHSEGAPIDMLTVCKRAAEWKKAGKLELNLTEISECIEHCPASVNTPYYAREVRSAAKRRRAIEALQRHEKALRDGTWDGATVDEMVDAAAEELTRVSQSATTKRTIVSLPEMHRELLEQERRAMEEGYEPRVFPTGLRGLDAEIYRHGFCGGQMIILGGRPACGKTGLAMGIALHMASEGRRVLYWSGEESPEELTRRTRRNLARDAEWSADAFDDLGGMSFMDVSGASIYRIEREARRMADGRRGLDAMFIDYIQLLDHCKERGESTADAVARTSRRVKVIARDLDIPIIVTAQLNREIEKRSNGVKRGGGRDEEEDSGPIRPMARPAPGWFHHVPYPNLSDLRESGQLEQDADLVVFPLLSAMYGMQPSEEAALYISKQRNGDRNLCVPVHWDGPRSRYSDR